MPFGEDQLVPIFPERVIRIELHLFFVEKGKKIDNGKGPPYVAYSDLTDGIECFLTNFLGKRGCPSCCFGGVYTVSFL